MYGLLVMQCHSKCMGIALSKIMLSAGYKVASGLSTDTAYVRAFDYRATCIGRY
jgi:hypothetical protein